MRYRNSYIESRRTMADSGEYVADIKIQDPISALYFEFRATNGSTNNQAATMAQCIDAVEVLDGSDVLVSLDGPELFALTAFQGGHIPYSLISELPSVVQNLVGVIRFGRFEGDTVYALDPKKFVNLQVRVKWNLANVRAVGVTGFTTATGALTVIAKIMEDAPAPEGFIMAKEHYTWTTASAGVEYIDLPRDYPYVGMLLRADKAAYAINGVVNNVRLSCDAGKFVPFDQRMSDFVRMQSAKFAPFHYKHQFHAANADTVYAVLKQDEAISFGQGSQVDTVARYVNTGIGEGALALYSAGSAQTSDITVDALVHGWCPYRSVYMPFGQAEQPSDWFPAPDFGSVRLEATGAVASGSGYVALVQARRYSK